MKDSKSISLLVLSSVLLLLSVVLLATLGYQYYRQGIKLPSVAAKPRPIPVKTIVAPAVFPDSAQVRDSLRKIYNLALTNFESRPDSAILQPTTSDSARTSIADNLKEYYRLKDEIALLLQEKRSNADMILAKQKIAELQMKVDLLSYRNSDVEKENRRLYAMLEKLNRQSQDGTSTYSNIQVSNDGRTSARPAATAVLSAANLNLSARAADGDQETNDADETEKTDRFFYN